MKVSLLTILNLENDKIKFFSEILIKKIFFKYDTLLYIN